MHRPQEDSANFKWWVFGTIAFGTFISVISHGSVLVALPTIAEHFETSLSLVQWVVISETLAIAVLLLPMGRLGDLVGRRRIYTIGFLVFVLAAALAGSSRWTNLTTLLVAKAGQGVGSAMIQGNAVAMIISAFPERERGKALGSNLSVVGLGAIIGPALGGILVSIWGWQAVFLVNIPMGLLTIAATFIVLGGSQVGKATEPAERLRFDWLGAVLSGAALLLFLLLVGNGHQLGWTSPAVMVGAISFLAIFSGFVWWELRTDSPMLELRLFRSKLVSLGIAAGWISFLGTSSTRFMMPFYLQAVLGMSPRDMGLLMIPPALCLVILGPLSGQLSDKFGWRKFNVGGLALSASASFILAAWLSETFPVGWIVVMLMLQSAGTGLFNSPNNSSIMSAVDRSRYGVISALTNLTRNSANIVSIALATTIVVVVMELMGVEPSLQAVSPEVAGAFIVGLRWTFGLMGCLLVLGMAVSYLKGDRPPPAQETPQSAAVAERVRQNP